MCVFGAGCKHGLNCHRGHTDVEKKIFADKKVIREKEWMTPCVCMGQSPKYVSQYLVLFFDFWGCFC
jgi:hypothetical protein